MAHRLHALTLIGGSIALIVAAAAPPAGAATHPSGPKCFGKPPTVVGRGHNQVISLGGSVRNAVVDLTGKGETLNAGKAKGNTFVCDTGGARNINTGNGNDKVQIVNGDAHVSTGNGNDSFIQLGKGSPTVSLGAGNDIGTLKAGNGKIFGQDGNDVLHAGSSGHQTLNGGNGHDTLYAGTAQATLDGGPGGTTYVVPSRDARTTTTVTHTGDTVNGKPVTPPVASTPVPTPLPVTPPPVPVPVPPVPTSPAPSSAIVTFGGAGTAVPVEFDPDPTGLSSPLIGSVTFRLSGKPSGGRSLRSWTLGFGDGSPGIGGVGAPPLTETHNYLVVGTDTATLTLTDDLGQTTSSTATIVVATTPTATFSIDSTNQASRQMTGSFTGSAGQGTQLSSFLVDYGDGSAPQMTTSPPALLHTYSGLGNYFITLTVTDSAGVTRSTTQSVNFYDGSTVQAHLAAGAGGDGLGVAGTAVVLDASRSTGIRGSQTSDTYDAGSTQASVSPSASGTTADVVYPSGTFTATVTATDGSTGDNPKATATATVYVAANELAAVIAPSVAPPGSPTTFALNDTPDVAPSGGPAAVITSRTFDYGDGSDPVDLSSASVGPHTYAVPGVYAATYTVTDNYGGSVTTTRNLLVGSGTPFISVGFDQPFLTSTVPFGTSSPWVASVVSTSSAPATTFTLAGFGGSGAVSGSTFTLDFGDGTHPASGRFDGNGNAVVTDDGSGSPPSGILFTHAYTTVGEFTLAATVTDTAGRSTTVNQHVSISGDIVLTLGTTTQTGRTLHIPVTSYSPGQGAAATGYAVLIIAPTYGLNMTTYQFNGAVPPRIDLDAPTEFDSSQPVTIAVAASSDHGSTPFITTTFSS